MDACGLCGSAAEVSAHGVCEHCEYDEFQIAMAERGCDRELDYDPEYEWERWQQEVAR